MGLLGILIGLGLLIWLAYRGWSVIGLAPLAAVIAAAFSGQPLLAHWTQTFMGSAAAFIAQFFPLFLLGALFGKLMEDSGSVAAIADFMTEYLGTKRAILAVVLAGALVTYGGVSLFVAMFVIAPMGQALFRMANIPNRLLPAAIALGTTTFTMTAMPGTPAIQNAIPMPFFGTTTFAAPGLGLIASAVMFIFGMGWLLRAQRRARLAGEGFDRKARVHLEAIGATEDVDADVVAEAAAHDPLVRERGSTATPFDPAEVTHGSDPASIPGIGIALLPLAVVIGVNVLMSLWLLPLLDTSFLAEPEWGGTSIYAVGGVWSVIIALASAILVLYFCNHRRLGTLRESVGAGINASALPIISVASLVGFGAVVAALPAFQVIIDRILAIEGGPLTSLAVSTTALSALTGSASGGMMIALDALADTYLQLAATYGIDPQLLHRVAVISAGSLDALPHNGAVVTLLAVCGATHRESYLDIIMVSIVSALLALVAVIVLGARFGSF